MINFLIIDGNSLLNRAFYGLPLLSTKDGRFTGGIHGFLNMLLKIQESCTPQAVAVAFDLRAPTFRHALYADYKAGRKGMPEELAQQLPVLKDLLFSMGYTLVEQEGYEADDILGTLAKHNAGEALCYLATGDRDALQLVDGNTSVLLTTTKMGRPQTVLYDRERIKAEYLVEPEQLIDIKALMGDSSDNIPGVAGIGQKTASDLISRFVSLDAIYADLDALDIKPGVREKLRAGRDSAYMSRELGRIHTDSPIDCDLAGYRMRTPDVRKVNAMLADLEMFKMIERLKLSQAPLEAQPSESPKSGFDIAEETDLDSLLARLKSDKKAHFLREDGGYVFVLADRLIRVKANAPCFAAFQAAFLECEQIAKYTDDSKTLYAEATRRGELLRGLAGDAAITGYVLNPSANGYDIPRLLQEYGVGGVEQTGLIASSDPVAYAAAGLPALFAVLLEKIQENGQADLLQQIELPLVRVLAEMELAGFAVDRQGLAAFGAALEERISEIEQTIYDQVGYSFNLNSPKQLGEALFDKLGLPTRKKTKTGYSTNAEVLESLAYEHPAVARILEYRALTKLKSTYCDGLVKSIAADGRIHSTLNQTETRTGRISSTEPNLQNIPVRSELGRELRRFFRAKAGCVLVDADYSQIELRVLAHIADDPAMIQAFNENQDIHAITASQVFHMPPELVTPLMRSRAKAVNFGIVYGIGAFSLSQDIGVSRGEAEHYIQDYLRHYAGVGAYMERVVEEAKRQGYVQTLFARRRYLPELAASNFNTRAFGERVARNMPIQGTAADIIKIAMIRVAERLNRENFAARLILQVHDELLVEAPKEESQAVAKLLKEEMEAAAQLKVKLSAEVHTGETWFDAKG